MKILGFIPARKGSKSIKNKNLIKFNRKPLIYSTINFSKKIKCLTPFVSTNSKKILNYSKKNGISFDYLRPDSLSTDKSKIIKSVFHALKWFKDKNIEFDAVMLLQPTSPVRNQNEVDKIIKVFKQKKLNSIVSATKMYEHPFECIKIEGKKWHYIENNPKKSSMRQDYSKSYYFIDGSIYLSSVDFLKKNKSFVVKNKTKIFKSSQFPGIDIDNLTNLRLGEFFMDKKNK